MDIVKIPESSFEIRNLRYKNAVNNPQNNPPMQPISNDAHHIQPFKTHIPLNAAPIRKDPSGVISGNPTTLNEVMVPIAKTEYNSPTISDAQHKFNIILSYLIIFASLTILSGYTILKYSELLLLITNFPIVGLTTGNSDGFSPFRIRTPNLPVSIPNS